LGGPFRDSGRGRREGVYCVGIVAMLITWPGELSALRHSEGNVIEYIRRHFSTSLWVSMLCERERFVWNWERVVA
jgi:hypothetical protein